MSANKKTISYALAGACSGDLYRLVNGQWSKVACLDQATMFSSIPQLTRALQYCGPDDRRDLNIVKVTTEEVPGEEEYTTDLFPRKDGDTFIGYLHSGQYITNPGFILSHSRRDAQRFQTVDGIAQWVNRGGYALRTVYRVTTGKPTIRVKTEVLG